MGKKNDNYLVQGSILAAAGIVVRLIGLFYKVPMTRILGDEGIGYYNTAYEIYNIGLILSSYSLPLAVSKQIAKSRGGRKKGDIDRVFNCGIAFGAVTGGVMTVLLIFGADWIASSIFNSPGSALPLKVMAPTILVFAVMGVFRGFFQGRGNMIPTSISQIIEQLVHAGVSIWASYDFMKRFASQPNPASYGAAGGTLGTFVGALAAFAFLGVVMIAYRHGHKGREGERHSSYRRVAMGLFLTVVPIILSQTVYQLSGSVDNSMFGLIMGGKGFGEQERMELLGIYSGKYRLLTNVPVAIATSLGASMIPSIVTSRAMQKNGAVRRKIYMTIKFNMLIAIPCAVGMGVLASPILQLLFGDSRELSAQLLMMGASAVVFFSLSTVTNAVLQGIDLMAKSVTHSAISLAIHVVLVYLMLDKLNWGVYGLVLGNVTFALVVCVLNWISIGQTMRYRQEVITTFILPAAVSAVMGAAAFGVYHLVYLILHSNALSLLVAVPAAMAVYGVGIIKTQAVRPRELKEMPMGGRLLRLCRKLGLM